MNNSYIDTYGYK